MIYRSEIYESCFSSPLGAMGKLENIPDKTNLSSPLGVRGSYLNSPLGARGHGI